MNTPMHSFYVLEMKKNVIAIKFEKQLTATKEAMYAESWVLIT